MKDEGDEGGRHKQRRSSNGETSKVDPPNVEGKQNRAETMPGNIAETDGAAASNKKESKVAEELRNQIRKAMISGICSP